MTRWWFFEPKSKGLIKTIGALIKGIKVKTITRITTTNGLDTKIEVEVNIVTERGRMIKRLT